MKNKSFVSVIVPTKNSEIFIVNCLESIKNQTYKNIELIVVDNNSIDKTKEIALGFTKKVFNKGPERSAQRNFGAAKANGKYLLFIDSDMELDENVISECIEKIEKSDREIGGIIIPEKSFGTSFWAKCKELERSFYEGIDWLEGARFFPKKIFNSVGGYDVNLVSGEDWDLSQRVEREYRIERIKSYVLHNEGDLKLMNTLKKKYYYAKQISNYSSKHINDKKFSIQSNPISRYKLFFSDPKKLFKNPILGIGMLFMKTMEFASGLAGIIGKILSS